MNIPQANELKLSGIKGTQYYGGNQDWYSSNSWAMAGCGSVAGANALRCLARHNRDVRRSIISSKKLPSQIKSALCSPSASSDNYSLLMTDVYNKMKAVEIFPINRIYDKSERGKKIFNYIKPNFGLTNTGFIIGIIRYAFKIGLCIKVSFLPTAFCDFENGRDFIEKGLKESGAVVILTSYNDHNIRLFPGNSSLEQPLESSQKGYDARMKCHFATITDIDSENDRLLITTWGRPAIGDLKEIAASWQSIKGFQSTLMYISPSTRQESIKSILNSWKPYVFGTIQAIIRRNLYI